MFQVLVTVAHTSIFTEIALPEIILTETMNARKNKAIRAARIIHLGTICLPGSQTRKEIMNAEWSLCFFFIQPAQEITKL